MGHRARHGRAGWFCKDHWKEGAGQERTEPFTALQRIAKLLSVTGWAEQDKEAKVPHANSRHEGQDMSRLE